MRRLILDFFRILILLAKPNGHRNLLAENLLLRHQLCVLIRKKNLRRSPSFTVTDRFIFAALLAFIPKRFLKKVILIAKPATIIGFHQALVKRKYRLLFSNKGKRRKPGPKGPDKDLIRLVLEVKRSNPPMGCLQIANLISNNFSVTIDRSLVRRILKEKMKPEPDGGPSWLSFIGDAKDSLWTLDLFKCESVFLTCYYVMLVMDQFSRKIVGSAVVRAPLNGEKICRMFNQVRKGNPTPLRLSTDNDPLFRFFQWQANLRVLEIKPLRSVSSVPWSHPYIESLIGKIRTEYLDKTLFLNKRDLEMKLGKYVTYYNEARVHSSISAQPPLEFLGKKQKIKSDLDNYKWKSYCNGLFQVPIAA